MSDFRNTVHLPVTPPPSNNASRISRRRKRRWIDCTQSGRSWKRGKKNPASHPSHDALDRNLRPASHQLLKVGESDD